MEAIPLGENRGGTPSDERAPQERAPHRKVRRWCPRLPAFRLLRFSSFFVARMERSEIRDGGADGYIVPGLRCAPSGLRNRRRKDRKAGPTPSFPLFRARFRVEQ